MGSGVETQPKLNSKHFSLKISHTTGGNKFNDFPENQRTKFHAEFPNFSGFTLSGKGYFLGLPVNLLDTILQSKLLSFMYTVLAENWEPIYCMSQNIGGRGLEPLGTHEAGDYWVWGTVESSAKAPVGDLGDEMLDSSTEAEEFL